MGDGQIALVAFKELDAEFILQGLELQAERRLGNVQIFGRCRDMARFCDC